ncbi:MAG: YncE family protein [Enhygromyxa sp.]
MLARSAAPWKLAAVLGASACASPSALSSEAAVVVAPAAPLVPEPSPLVSFSPRASTFVEDEALALTVAARVKTGIQPKSVTLSPDGAQLWVCNFGFSGRKNVYVYDSTTLERIAKVEFEGNAVETAFAHDGSRAYVSNFSRGVLEVIDPASFRVLSEIKVGRYPKVIAVSPDDARIYVANWGSADVAVIDASTNEVIERHPTGPRPRGMALRDDGTLFVDAMWAHVVHVFPRDHEQWRIPTCQFPRHAVFAPSDDALFVTCSGDDRLRWHDPDDGRVLGEAQVGDNPRSFALSDDGRWSAVANFDGSSVTLVDLLVGRRYTTAVPETKRIVGLTMARGEALRVFVTSWGNNQLLELHPTNHATQPASPPSTPISAAEPMNTADMGWRSMKRSSL